MGDFNQLAYLRHWVPAVDGPVLEVGSRDYGSTASYREFYSGSEYVGLDMSEGKGVDVVANLAHSIEPLREDYFGLGICCSVLEHVDKPWVFAANLTRVIRPGGKLYMSVPWVWRYHAYPDDYFRFSHRGVMALFDEFEWAHACYSTTVDNEFIEINEMKSRDDGADNRMAVEFKRGDDKRKYLPYLMVNMLGTRRARSPA